MENSAYKKQKLPTLREHLSLPPVCFLVVFFGGVRVAHLLVFFVLSYYVSLRSEFRVVMSVMISGWKRCSVCIYLQLIVGGLIFYLRYLYLFGYGGLQHMLCCVFALFFFVLCTLCYQFLWIVFFFITPSVFYNFY